MRKFRLRRWLASRIWISRLDYICALSTGFVWATWGLGGLLVWLVIGSCLIVWVDRGK